MWAQPREPAVPCFTPCGQRWPCSGQDQSLPWLYSPSSQHPCWGGSLVLGGGLPRAHVKLELGGSSKLSLSHRYERWQPLWLASDVGRCPTVTNGKSTAGLCARVGVGLRGDTCCYRSKKREEGGQKQLEETKEKGKEKEGRRERKRIEGKRKKNDRAGNSEVPACAAEFVSGCVHGNYCPNASAEEAGDCLPALTRLPAAARACLQDVYFPSAGSPGCNMPGKPTDPAAGGGCGGF